MASRRISTYAEFWPYYLREHSRPICRWLHYFGTTLALLNIVYAAVSLNPWFLLSAAVSGYFFAWIGHFVFEKNRPATFQYPLWSLLSDFRMYVWWLAGKLPAELRRAQEHSLP